MFTAYLKILLHHAYNGVEYPDLHRCLSSVPALTYSKWSPEPYSPLFALHASSSPQSLLQTQVRITERPIVRGEPPLSQTEVRQCFGTNVYASCCAEESYRHARWEPLDKVMKGKPQLVRNFMQRRASEPADDELVNGIHPNWLVVERVIAQNMTVRRHEYLVKCVPLLLLWRSVSDH